jgi:tetratricopeptide (TPR) repeat protein
MSRRSNGRITRAPDQKLLDEAIQLHQEGRLVDAVQRYQRILAAEPDHADALHLSGVVAQQQGRLPQAIEYIERALARQPQNAIFHSNLALALRAVGRLPDAIKHLRKAVRLDPTYLAGARNLATVLHEQGQFDEAEQTLEAIAKHHPRDPGIFRIYGLIRLKQARVQEAEAAFRKALALDPNDAESRNNLGLALKEQRRFAEAEAELRQALALKPDAANVLNNLGLLCTEQGRLGEAERYYLDLLKSDPCAIRTLNNLGVTLKQAGRLDDAERWLRRALTIESHDVATLTNYGDVLNSLTRHTEAQRYLEMAVQFDPSCAEAHNNLGVTLKELGHTMDSIAHLERSLQINPTYTPALNNLGNALVSRGQIADGTQKFLRVLELDPNDVPAVFALATSTRHKFTDSEVQRVQEMLSHPRIGANERELLHFALATVLDKRGSHDAAFEHAIAANKSKNESYRRRGLGFDQAGHRELCNALINVFSSSSFSRLPTSGVEMEEPVFVVGMPRSGTSLVEQILASHPAVFGAGELIDIPQLAADLPRLLGSNLNYPRCLDRLDGTKARKLATRHLARLLELGSGATRVVDKMTINFQHLGLIALLFPKARIIHCRRDSRDICLSCFFHNFASPGLNFTFALEDLGFYYQQYERLMEHWQQVLPMPIFEIRYEELVHEPEKWTRALLEYCGLEWDDRCLDFHQTERQVKTASALQVRQPMYTGSVGRWKPYETHLQPLLRAFRQPPHEAVETDAAADKTPVPIQTLIETALKLHQTGDHTTARSYYQEIPKQDPAHPDALHLTGLLEHQDGRHANALEHIQRAIAAKPDNPAYHSNAGLVLRALDRREEAATALSRAVELDPGYTVAHRNLGVVLRELGRLADAEQCLRLVLACDSRDAAAWRNLGLTLLTRGAHAESIDAFRQALSVNPDDFEAHNNIGIALKDLKRLPDSEVSHREAVRLRPDHPGAHNNLGIVLSAMGRSDEARTCFVEALRLDPEYADARHNVGAVLAELGKHVEAVGHFCAALNLDARNAEYHNSLGASLQVLGSPREALVSYDRALSLDPSHAWSHFNRSQALLLLGKYEEGWREWEWRRKLPGAKHRKYDGCRWDGNPMPYGTVLLHTEQGYGDTIQFIRFCRHVRQRVGRIIVECQPALTILLRSCPWIDVVVGRGDPLPPFDAYAPLMSVPALLRVSPDDIRVETPYLSVDAPLAGQWRNNLPCVSGLRVGIAWQGNPKHRHDRFRSVDPSAFAPLASMPGVHLICLQKGPGRENLARRSFPIHQVGETMVETPESFTETAAIIKCLDLVISVDTVVSHLAGALDVPVWLALPFASDWRWGQEGDTTPWYPTMRLFRQPARGQWAPVFDNIRAELARLASGSPPVDAKSLEVPISPGELIDRITIYEIDLDRSPDSKTTSNLRRTLQILRSIRDRRLPNAPRLVELAASLKDVNDHLRQIEDELRDCDHRNDFGPRFIELARSIHSTNELRSKLKRNIDQLLNPPAGGA